MSKSGYYAAKAAPESLRAREQRRIVTEILEAHGDRHTRAYGSPRMTVELRDRDIQCSENRVARIMAKQGISGRCKSTFRPRDHSRRP